MGRRRWISFSARANTPGASVRWLVGDEAMSDLAGVESKLARIFQANADAPVIIDPDNATPLGDVIDVYDLSRRVGFDKVQFAVAEDASRVDS